MNPNSAHQLWSYWRVEIRLQSRVVWHAVDAQRATCALLRAARAVHGSGGLARVRCVPRGVVVEVRADRDRHPDQAADVLAIRRAWQDAAARIVPWRSVVVDARLLAGERLVRGAPRHTWLIAPPMVMPTAAAVS